MQNKGKSSIDDFFAKRLNENVEETYRPEYWQAFEQQLNEVMPVQRKRRGVLWTVLFAGLFTSGYLYFNSEPTTTSTEQNTSTHVLPSTTINTAQLNTKKETKPLKATSSPNYEQVTSPQGVASSSLTAKLEGRSIDQKAPKSIVPPQQETIPVPVSEHPNSPSLAMVMDTSMGEAEPNGLVILDETTAPSTSSSRTKGESNELEKKREIDSLPIVNPIQEAVVMEKDPVVAKVQGEPHEQFSLVFGTNYSRGFSNTSLSGKKVIDPLIGLSYYRSISPNSGFAMEGHYVSKGGHHLQQENEMVSYFLDKNVERNTIETRRIHYLQFPVRTTWKWHSRHQVSGGILVRTVLNTTSKGNRTIVVNGKTYTANLGSDLSGYRKGITTWSYGFVAAYEFRLSYNWTLELRYLQGWNDQTNESDYNSSKNDVGKDLQLNLKYHLFRH
jgi:hypothetical protein